MIWILDNHEKIIMHLLFSGYADVVKYIIDNIGDVNPKNKEGYTSLQLANQWVKRH